MPDLVPPASSTNHTFLPQNYSYALPPQRHDPPHIVQSDSHLEGGSAPFGPVELHPYHPPVPSAPAPASGIADVPVLDGSESRGKKRSKSFRLAVVNMLNREAESQTMELRHGKPRIDAYSKRSKNLIKKVLFSIFVYFGQADLGLVG